jgi:hypothetical protein
MFGAARYRRIAIFLVISRGMFNRMEDGGS